MKRVTGIGGIFFNARDPLTLRAWYKSHLGIDVQDWGGAAFRWKGPVFEISALTREGCEPLIRALYTFVAPLNAPPIEEPDARFVEVLTAPFDPAPSFLPAAAQFGARAPLIDRAATFVADARRLVRAGSVVAIDYATPITAMSLCAKACR